jgi:hypothetical protein
MGSFIVDCLILLWLVGTWFYEGHHKKCQVTALCPKCGATTDFPCAADRNNN